ncbi:MAG: hypothetical protein HKO62_12845 [Gammaproteobacteria bacterium]|nr:hypothetical protein [Gammaproteobacteria bacterium]
MSAVTLTAALIYSCGAAAAIVWDGPDVLFSKVGTQPDSVQDVLSAEVSLTRGNSGILFNPLGGDTGPAVGTPTGTRWAFDTAIGNPGDAAFAAANFAELTFLPFLAAVGGPTSAGGAGVPNVVLGNPGVLHLVAADVYLDIQFLSWTSAFDNPGSAVEYLRSSAAVVPVPAALPLFAAGLALLRWRGRAPRAPRHH